MGFSLLMGKGKVKQMRVLVRCGSARAEPTLSFSSDGAEEVEAEVGTQVVVCTGSRSMWEWTSGADFELLF